MLNRMFAHRQSAAMLVRMPQRNFSLLVPLQKAAPLPADAVSHEMTEAHTSALAEEYRKFNEDCDQQRETMNSNLIENILPNIQDWEQSAELIDLKKAFTFSSFEEAQAFCQHVTVVAN